jgi:hypothetical protein
LRTRGRRVEVVRLKRAVCLAHDRSHDRGARDDPALRVFVNDASVRYANARGEVVRRNAVVGKVSGKSVHAWMVSDHDTVGKNVSLWETVRFSFSNSVN